MLKMKCHHLFDKLLSPDCGGYSDFTHPILTAAKTEQVRKRRTHYTSQVDGLCFQDSSIFFHQSRQAEMMTELI